MLRPHYNYTKCARTFGEYCSPLLKQLKLTTIQDMIKQDTVSMVYKEINNKAPEYLSVLFTRVSTMTHRIINNIDMNLHTEGLCFGITCRQK